MAEDRGGNIFAAGFTGTILGIVIGAAAVAFSDQKMRQKTLKKTALLQKRLQKKLSTMKDAFFSDENALGESSPKEVLPIRKAKPTITSN